jgi:hypothetical protein
MTAVRAAEFFLPGTAPEASALFYKGIAWMRRRKTGLRKALRFFPSRFRWGPTAPL